MKLTDDGVTIGLLAMDEIQLIVAHPEAVGFYLIDTVNGNSYVTDSIAYTQTPVSALANRMAQVEAHVKESLYGHDDDN